MKEGIKKSYEEWLACRNREVDPGFLVKWTIRVTMISSFGGRYGRGFIEGNKNCKLHLLWDPEGAFADFLDSKKRSNVAAVEGRFEGVTENGEVIIEVIGVKSPH